ncbi:MAG: hypothetical protein KIS79_15490 [Burkholderiales bacterium]|nr:hypothetical protein [Burkholderiales bacterium]
MSGQLLERKWNGLAEYEKAMDELLARAQRTLRIFDRQLSRSFDAATRCTLLRTFLLADARNRIRIVLHETANLPRDCTRLLALQRQFAHAVLIHETQAPARTVHDPFAVADERDHLHRFHHDQARGVLRLDQVSETRVFVERFEEIWSYSVPSLNATTLGL